SADLDDFCRGLRDDADQLRDEEYRRLLYVAMTRAEDRLYVCGWTSRRPIGFDKSWYAVIVAALRDAPWVTIASNHALPTDPDFPDGAVLRLQTEQPARRDAAAAPPLTPLVQPLQTWAVTPPPPEESPPRPLAPSQAVRVDPPALSPLATQRFQRG